MSVLEMTPHYRNGDKLSILNCTVVDNPNYNIYSYYSRRRDMPPKGWRGRYKQAGTASDYLQNKSLEIVRRSYMLAIKTMRDPQVSAATKFQMISTLLPYAVPRLSQIKANIGTTKAQDLYDTLLALRDEETERRLALPTVTVLEGDGDEPTEEGIEQESDFGEHPRTDQEWLSPEASCSDSLRHGGEEKEEEKEVGGEWNLKS